jgi:hypothetical protein
MSFKYFIDLFWNYVAIPLHQFIRTFAKYNKYYVNLFAQPTPRVRFQQLTPVEKYIDKQGCLFMDQIQGYELNHLKYNANIQPVFYNHDEYEANITAKDNILENSWKQRVLMEYTPQGNIYMYYNAYHKAFSYYADTQIPYKLLNAVAMKYVRTFYCFDFFTDTQVLPENRVSPFTIMNQEQERLDKLKKDKKKKDLGINFQDAPFLRPKKKEKEKEKTVEGGEKIKRKPAVYKNVFKYCGSYRNLFMLKTNEIRKVVPNFISIPQTYSEFKLKQMM